MHGARCRLQGAGCMVFYLTLAMLQPIIMSRTQALELISAVITGHR